MSIRDWFKRSGKDEESAAPSSRSAESLPPWDLNNPIAQLFFTGSDSISGGSSLLSRERAFRESIWVYRCIVAISQSIGGLPYQLFKGTTLVNEHPIYDLVEKPNPYFSTTDLWYRTSAMLNLFGECFWYLDRKNALQFPTRIEFIDPRVVQLRMNAANTEIEGYQVNVQGKNMVLLPKDVVHFKFPNPLNQFRGISPLDAVSLGVSSDVAVQKFNLEFFRRGAVPLGLLITAGKLQKEQADQILNSFEARHKDAHRPAILHSGMDYKETQMSNRDMDFINLRKMNREEILACFGVQPVAVGLVDSGAVVGQSSAKTQWRVMWESTLLPQSKLIADTVDRQLIRDPTLHSIFSTHHISVLREDLSDKVDIAYKLFSMGIAWNTIDELLDIGTGKIDGGEVGYLPVNMQPVTDASSVPSGSKPSPGTTPPATPSGEPTESEDSPKPEVVNESEIWTRIEKKLNDFKLPLADQYREICELLEKSKVELADIARPYLTAMAEIGARQVRAGETDVRDVAEDQVAELVLLEEATRKKLYSMIVESNGDAAAVAAGVRKDFNLGPERAGKLAESFAIATVNAARMMAMVDAGVVEHVWVSAKDCGVESHRELEGASRHVGEVFGFTGCRYPGDLSADSMHVVDCKCYTSPVGRDTVPLPNALVPVKTVVDELAPKLSKHFFRERKAILSILLAENR